LRPHSWFIDFAPGNFGDNALTVTVATSDIVGHHSFAGSITADPAIATPMFTFDYVYGRLPVDMGLRLANRVTPRTDFRFNDQELTYRENSYSVQTSLSYAHPQEFGVQRFSLSHNLAVLDAELPFDTAGRLDPWAQPTVEPLRGLISFVHLGYSFSNAETSIDTAGGAVRGYSLNLGFDVGDETTGSEESIYAGTYSAIGYFPMPWRGSHVLAIRSSGGLSAGTFARRGLFFVGGFNLDEYNFLDTLTTGVFNGAFALRGYPPGSFSGRAYTLENFEYRFPIADIDAGPATVPVYLRRVSGNLFLDWGGAFNAPDFDSVELFSKGAIVYSPQTHTGAGAELWLTLTLGYGVDTQIRLGYAYGFGAPRVPHGQFYFIVSSAF
jgi:outer membrane protein assembly factor BamA